MTRMGPIVRAPDGRLVEIDTSNRNERLWTGMALDLGIVTQFAPYAWHGELVAIERQRGRAWPICCAREWPKDDWWNAPKGEPYPWCPLKARWRLGEMTVCPEHAAQMALGILVQGVPLDGRWKR